MVLERANYAAGREEWDAARELYDRALRLDPRLADAHLAIAKILLRGDDKAGAGPHLTRYIELQPKGASAAWARRQLE